ncbi:MAG: hypothetical protein H7210_13295 [Pyrinomonadaceae bacterium]|nr:hypothetical protein [Phycisphaerales bacterium]
MSWQERDYRDMPDEGAWRKALRRVFGDTENFFSWSIGLCRISRIDVRIHLTFVLFIVFKMIWAATVDLHSFIVAGISSLVLFTLVLMHEFGHCLACRWVKGEANEIIMWPLGGLAMCIPPKTWRANLITTAGGPMVNVVLVPILALLLLAMGATTQQLIFNPLMPGSVMGSAWLTGPINYLRIAVWLAYYTNLALLAFNVLLPMFPMDGGRLLQEFLWSKQGYGKSMHNATTIGLVFAVVLGLFAMTARSDKSSNEATSNLLMIAVFCGFTCWTEKKRLAAAANLGGAEYDFAPAYRGARDEESDAEKVLAASKRRIKAEETESKRQEEVDRILSKIRETGMGSLTRKEEQTLRGETERRRGKQG